MSSYKSIFTIKRTVEHINYFWAYAKKMQVKWLETVRQTYHWHNYFFFICYYTYLPGFLKTGSLVFNVFPALNSGVELARYFWEGGGGGSVKAGMVNVCRDRAVRPWAFGVDSSKGRGATLDQKWALRVVWSGKLVTCAVLQWLVSHLWA